MRNFIYHSSFPSKSNDATNPSNGRPRAPPWRCVVSALASARRAGDPPRRPRRVSPSRASAVSSVQSRQQTLADSTPSSPKQLDLRRGHGGTAHTEHTPGRWSGDRLMSMLSTLLPSANAYPAVPPWSRTMSRGTNYSFGWVEGPRLD